jgi:hypothetical protein
MCHLSEGPHLRPDSTGLVVGYASLGEREIDQGVQRLAAVLEEFRRGFPMPAARVRGTVRDGRHSR